MRKSRSENDNVHSMSDWCSRKTLGEAIFKRMIIIDNFSELNRNEFALQKYKTSRRNKLKQIYTVVRHIK